MIKLPPVRSARAFIDFNGGLDLVTPISRKAPGVLRACSNVEIGVNGGYARIGGTERFDGRAKPSDATYSVLPCSISGVSLGDVLTDDGGTAYGTVIALPTGFAILTLVTGSFAVGNVKVGGVLKGTCSAAQSVGGYTGATDAAYKNLAADVYRALIGVVPGSGSILGVHIYNDNVYAFRNNAGGTAAVMHVQSTSGWTAVTMHKKVAFTVGSGAAIAVGGTLTQGGVTATIRAVVVRTGSLGAGTAVGVLVINNPAGGNFAAGAATVGAGTLTLSGAEAAISFAPGGRFEFDNINFGGGSGTKKMYGCDGVSLAFEYDGSTVVPIATGMTTDTPLHIKGHRNHLFLSFTTSAQHSSIGNPYAWTPVTGAGELAMQDDITGFVTVPGSETAGAMCIKTQDRTAILYGNDSTDWNLVPLSEEAGGRRYTLQSLGLPLCLDSQGVTRLDSTQNYGNFQSAVVSDMITPALNDLIPSAIASCIVREKNQYRLFFQGGGAYYFTFKGRKLLGITQVDLTDAVTCITSLEGSSGREEIYYGSTDGYVYQMDKGTSFDGDPIPWNATLSYNNLGAPRQLKSFTHFSPTIEGEGYSELNFSYTVGYGSTNFSTPDMEVLENTLSSSAQWDTGTWDVLVWDGVSVSPSNCDVRGTAENISLYFGGSSDEFAPFTMSGGILHYKPRREMRAGG
jgi:hypothetical protein